MFRSDSLHRFALRSLPSQSDARLIELISSGYHSAFEEFYRRHEPRLRHYAIKIAGRGEAQEAVQQAFVKAYQAIIDGQEVREPSAWLNRICYHESLKLLEAQARTVAVEEPLLLAAGGGGAMSAPSAETEAGSRERLRSLIAGIEGLPERQRLALLRREIEGRSYDEIAAELGETRPVVRQLLHRARRNLKHAVGVLIPVSVLSRWLSPSSAQAATTGAGVGAASAGVAASAGGSGLAVKIGTIASVLALAGGGGAVAIHANGGTNTPAQAPAKIQSRPAAQTPSAPLNYEVDGAISWAPLAGSRGFGLYIVKTSTPKRSMMLNREWAAQLSADAQIEPAGAKLTRRTLVHAVISGYADSDGTLRVTRIVVQR